MREESAVSGTGCLNELTDGGCRGAGDIQTEAHSRTESGMLGQYCYGVSVVCLPRVHVLVACSPPGDVRSGELLKAKVWRPSGGNMIVPVGPGSSVVMHKA